MANEITHNTITGLTLYFCCFQQDGDVFLTGGASDEVWGTGGRTAADYDEAMTEEDACGHYKGSMAAGIGAGVYQIAVYQQAGGAPATGDRAIAQGEIYWTGTAEATLYDVYVDTNEIQGKLPDDYIMGSSVTTSMDDEINNINANSGKVVYGSVSSTSGVKQTINAGSVTGFVPDEDRP